MLAAVPGDAIPCRIAFEKGKERSVYLLVCSKGTAGWVLLAEDVPLKQRKGIIRVIAALAGSNVRTSQLIIRMCRIHCQKSTLTLWIAFFLAFAPLFFWAA